MAELLTDKEVEILILSFMGSRKERGATEVELESVIAWAAKIRLGELLISMTLKGTIEIIGVEDGQPLFSSSKE